MEEYKVGDWITILKKPDKWASGLNANNPLYAGLEYPLTVKIENIRFQSYCTEISAGNYGWSLDELLKHNIVRKAIPEKIEKYTGISTESVNYEIY